MADNKQIASDVLAAVGGKDNVSFVTHCITRLRFKVTNHQLSWWFGYAPPGQITRSA